MFKPHGSVRVWSEGPLLISAFQGPWNYELGEQWMKLVTPAAVALGARGPFASLAIISGSVLSSPETLVLLRKVTRAGRATGMVANAHVVASDVEGACFAASIYAPVFEGLVPHRCFDDVESARAWLLAHLAQAPSGTPANT